MINNSTFPVLYKLILVAITILYYLITLQECCVICVTSLSGTFCRTWTLMKVSTGIISIKTIRSP